LFLVAVVSVPGLNDIDPSPDPTRPPVNFGIFVPINKA
jgi:hypothetical protein